MTIELNEKSYILCIWFASCPQTENDLMITVIKDPDKEGYWKGKMRVRQKIDDNIFDSNDLKTWYSFETNVPMTEDEMIRKQHEMMESTKVLFPEIDFVIVQGGVEAFLEKAKEKPWMHMKVEDIKNE